MFLVIVAAIVVSYILIAMSQSTQGVAWLVVLGSIVGAFLINPLIGFVVLGICVYGAFEGLAKS